MILNVRNKPPKMSKRSIEFSVSCDESYNLCHDLNSYGCPSAVEKSSVFLCGSYDVIFEVLNNISFLAGLSILCIIAVLIIY